MFVPLFFKEHPTLGDPVMLSSQHVSESKGTLLWITSRQQAYAGAIPSQVGFVAALPNRGGSDGDESACNAGDQGSIPGSRKLPGEGNGYARQNSSCLENSMDRGAWQATSVHGVTKS